VPRICGSHHKSECEAHARQQVGARRGYPSCQGAAPRPNAPCFQCSRIIIGLRCRAAASTHSTPGAASGSRTAYVLRVSAILAARVHHVASAGRRSQVGEAEQPASDEEARCALCSTWTLGLVIHLCAHVRLMEPVNTRLGEVREALARRD